MLPGPGEVLLLPPQLRHAERVGAGVDGAPFRNIVIYADEALLTCHIAEESTPGGQLGCAADYLSHIFRHSTGERLTAYINRQRMVRAARLLRESGLAGKEVAWAAWLRATTGS